jgi:alkylresorcinol/alkylpyrone synthase
MQAYGEVARSLFVETTTKALGKAGLKGSDVDCIVTVCSTGIATPSLDAQLAGIERAVLSEYGNMSSLAVLFVLERVLHDGLPERSAMLAIGPGFAASCMTLKRIG